MCIRDRIDTINRMVRDGELPNGDTCVISGLPTSDSYDLYVQCESKWIKGAGRGRNLFAMLMALFVPFGMLFGRGASYGERRELGRDRGVYIPLRIREEYHQQLRGMRSQAKLRKLLRAVPIYAKLLDEFPRAKIIVQLNG